MKDIGNNQDSIRDNPPLIYNGFVESVVLAGSVCNMMITLPGKQEYDMNNSKDVNSIYTCDPFYYQEYVMHHKDTMMFLASWPMSKLPIHIILEII